MQAFGFRSALSIFYKSQFKNNEIPRVKMQLDTAQINGTSEEFSVFQVDQFLNLMKDKIIQEFLKFDRCFKLADKYLLSMVFVYFVRAKLLLSDYTRTNFFVALYLAHDIEEDDEDLKICFVDWGLGASRRGDFDHFTSLRNKMWASMEFRACVSLKTCHQVMEVISNCDLWERERDPAHGGAVREHQQTVLEKCRHCDDLDKNQRFYWSDYEFSTETGSGESDSDDVSDPPLKKIKITNEE